MKSEISELYDEIMAGEQNPEASAETEKTAGDASADDGPLFDATFFEKVAAGEDESVDTLNQFIEEARGEGYDDDQIEEAIGEAMQAAGYGEAGEAPAAVEEPETDEYEQAKMSAYIEGSEKALEDMLNSDMAKAAGITAEDVVEYELGNCFGAGYFETRQELDEDLAKIAEAKKETGAQALVAKIAEKKKGKGMSPAAAGALGAAGVGAAGGAAYGGHKGYKALKAVGGGESAMAGAKGVGGALRERMGEILGKKGKQYATMGGRARAHGLSALAAKAAKAAKKVAK